MADAKATAAPTDAPPPIIARSLKGPKTLLGIDPSTPTAVVSEMTVFQRVIVSNETVIEVETDVISDVMSDVRVTYTVTGTGIAIVRTNVT